MPTETHEELPRRPLQSCWPDKFTKRRPFDRPAENQPYIEYLRTPKFIGEEDEADVSSEEDEEDDVSNENEDEVEGYREKVENEDEYRNENKGAESCNGYGDVRLFMTGATRDEETLKYCDQVEEVASFCEQTSVRELERKTGQYRKRVALLDDRNVCGTVSGNQGHCQCTGHCRPYLGPMTPQQLVKELKKKVAHITYLN
jgi:hypothetical protein